MDYADSIGASLVRLRRANGISQRELGARIGVKQQQIARWESLEYRTAPLERVEQIARALGYMSVAMLAAEAPAIYATSRTEPVSDLGEIVRLVREVGPRLASEFGLRSIAVFGSFATGQQRAESDVDLLVEFDERPSGFAFFEPIEYLEGLLGRKVDLVELERLKTPVRDRAMKEAVGVWQTR